MNVFACFKRQWERKRGTTQSDCGKKKGLRGVEGEARMEPSLCFLRSSAVRDEETISHKEAGMLMSALFHRPAPRKGV